MNFERKYKIIAIVKSVICIMFIIGLVSLKACSWDEVPMRCYWCLTSLRISSFSIAMNNILSYKVKGIGCKIYSCIMGIVLESTVLLIIFCIGVCPASMVCAKIKLFVSTCSIIMLFVELLQLFVLYQMKKYSLED